MKRLWWHWACDEGGRRCFCLENGAETGCERDHGFGTMTEVLQWRKLHDQQINFGILQSSGMAVLETSGRTRNAVPQMCPVLVHPNLIIPSRIVSLMAWIVDRRHTREIEVTDSIDDRNLASLCCERRSVALITSATVTCR